MASHVSYIMCIVAIMLGTWLAGEVVMCKRFK